MYLKYLVFFCLQAYKTHLATQGHTASLRGLKMKLANKIGLIRNTQRRSQNRLTKQMEIDGNLENGGFTNYDNYFFIKKRKTIS